MASLTDFLIENNVSDLTEEVILPGRLTAFKFKISVMTNKDFEGYSRLCRRLGKQGVSFDSEKFNMMTILDHTIEPNFRDAETIKKAGCKTPEEFVGRSLLPGEIVELARAIARLSGFSQDMNSLVDEAKN